MSFREKITQRIQEKDGDPFRQEDTDTANVDNVEAFVNSDYYGVDNLRNSPACVDLRLSDGSFRAVPYSHITEISFNPSEGIEINSTSKKIMITGRNLKMLYNYLVAYRVKFIKANVGNDLTDEKTLFVKGIQIEEA